MEEEQGQTNYKLRLNLPTTVFIVMQIIFIIFLVISLSRLSQPNEIDDWDTERTPVATISNFSAVAPENYSGGIKNIETTLFELILRNSPDKDISKSINASVREGSIKTVYFEDQNLNYLSAIVDIPDIEQSYWFYNEYSNDNPNPYINYSKTYRIFCLDSSQEIIYPNFDCKDDFGIGGKYELVSDLIPYFKFDDFFPLYYAQNNSNKIEISPDTFDELSNSTKELHIQQVRNAIDSLGISPDFFTYNVMSPSEIKYYYPIK